MSTHQFFPQYHQTYFECLSCHPTSSNYMRSWGASQYVLTNGIQYCRSVEGHTLRSQLQGRVTISGENFDNLDEQDPLRLHSFCVEQMDKAVSTFQSVQPNAGPSCQTVFSNVVVLDLDSVMKMSISSCKIFGLQLHMRKHCQLDHA